ncbi:MAG: hypothetical protein IJO19_05395 [Clostridia bacterium]|nr:hypothetical protein [Clostridia bacterium]
MNKDFIKALIQKYGVETQVLVAVEEMSELQKALLKNINRNSKNLTEVKEEMVDVSIMLEQLRYIYKISNREFSTIKKNKIERTKKRLND